MSEENEENYEDLEEIEDNNKKQSSSQNVDNINSDQSQNKERGQGYEDGEEPPIEIEVEDRGMNTDELPPEELQRLVDNNKELLEENDISNMDHEVKSELPLSKKELIEELNEKDKIFELLVKSNNELKNKIEISNKNIKKF